MTHLFCYEPMMVSRSKPHDAPWVSLRKIYKGSPIRVVAPSSPFDPIKLNQGINRLRQVGFALEDDSEILRTSHPFLNGTDAERVDELQDAFRSASDLIWIARGGYGLTRLSSQFSLPAQNDFPTVVGFSDATALLAHLYQNRIPCVHGPLATTLSREPEDSFLHLMGLLFDEPSFVRAFPLEALCGPQQDVDGRIFAGNLCVLTHLIGTPWMPDLTGTILCFEEIGERPYRIDRMLTQLLESHALDGVAGIAIGSLIDCAERVDTASDPLEPLPVIRARLEPLGVPVLSGLPIGHGIPNYALPIGSRAQLQCTPPQLILTEGLFP